MGRQIVGKTIDEIAGRMGSIIGRLLGIVGRVIKGYATGGTIKYHTPTSAPISHTVIHSKFWKWWLGVSQGLSAWISGDPGIIPRDFEPQKPQTSSATSMSSINRSTETYSPTLVLTPRCHLTASLIRHLKSQYSKFQHSRGSMKDKSKACYFVILYVLSFSWAPNFYMLSSPCNSSSMPNSHVWFVPRI